MRKFLLVLFALIASTGIAMAGGHMKNLVETAAGNDAFKTLVAAVKAAGLVETLAGKGHLQSLRQQMKRLPNCRKVPWKVC